MRSQIVVLFSGPQGAAAGVVLKINRLRCLGLGAAAVALVLPLLAHKAVGPDPDQGGAAGRGGHAPQRAGAGPLGGVTTTTGGAALVGVGAYSFVRKQRQDERDRRRAEAETAEPVYFENHTRSGTLRPGEQNNDL